MDGRPVATWTLAPAARRAVDRLSADLGDVFGRRLESLVVYGDRLVREDDEQSTSLDDALIHTLALVTDTSFSDLSACADRAERWTRAGLAVPLLLSRNEFVSSLDAFPLEFGDILDRHVTLVGRDPFQGVGVRREDVRRACEMQAKSHLIHLREGFLETGGRADQVGRLIRESVLALSALLANLARLDRADAATPEALARHAEQRLGLSGPLVRRLLTLRGPLAADEAVQLYPAYHDMTVKLARVVDSWKEQERA